MDAGIIKSPVHGKGVGTVRVVLDEWTYNLEVVMVSRAA